MRALCSAALVTGLAWAAAVSAADPARGEVIADTCMGCHGIPGYKNVYPTYDVPMLGGQNAEFIAEALKAYRSGDRRHPTMRVQAAPMTDQDIADIAAYFSSAPGGR
jgi:cytochrome c553